MQCGTRLLGVLFDELELFPFAPGMVDVEEQVDLGTSSDRELHDYLDRLLSQI